MNTSVTVSSQPQAKVTVSNQPQVITVSTNAAQKLSSLNDINTSLAQNGALLQYDAATNTWIARNIIESSGLVINCGNY